MYHVCLFVRNYNVFSAACPHSVGLDSNHGFILLYNSIYGPWNVKESTGKKTQGKTSLWEEEVCALWVLFLSLNPGFIKVSLSKYILWYIRCLLLLLVQVQCPTSTLHCQTMKLIQGFLQDIIWYSHIIILLLYYLFIFRKRWWANTTSWFPVFE